MNNSTYISEMVKAKISKADAERVMNELEQALTGVDNKIKAREIKRKVNEIIRGANVERHNMTILTLTEASDANSIKKYAARKAFEQNSHEALATKLVRVEKAKTREGKDYTKIIALDTTEYFDGDARTKKNPNYGKDLPTVLQHSSLAIDENGEIVTLYNASKDTKVNHSYAVPGKRKDKYLTVKKNVAYTRESEYNAKELYDFVNDNVSMFNEAIGNIDELENLKGNMRVLLKGYISDIGVTGGGTTKVILADDESVRNISCVATNKFIGDIMNGLVPSTEVIIFGKFNKFEIDGREFSNIKVTGIIPNPEVENNYSDKLVNISI